MPRALKIVLVIFGILVGTLVAVAIALPFFFDPNDYKDEIAAAVEDKTGRELSIAGEIELSVFPWLGAQIGQTQLSNAEGFGDQPFAEIDSVGVRVKLVPLLSKRIEIGTVSLDGLRLRLARDAQGNTNWDDIVEQMNQEQSDPTPEPPKKTEEGFSLPEFEIGAIEIADAAVSWQDVQNDVSYELSDFKLSTGRLSLGDPFRLESSFNLADGDTLSARTSFVTEAQLDLDTQFYRFKDLSLNVIAKGEPIPGGEQQVNLAGNAEVDMQAGRLKVSDLLLQAAGLSVTGSVAGNGLTAEPEFDGRITVKEFNPRSVMQQLGMQAPETASSSALTKAGLDAQFEGTPQRAEFKQIFIQLDESTLRGNASVVDFSNPAAAFKLSLDKLNVDNYLPPASQEKKEKPENPKDAASGEISLEALKDLKLDGRITADKLTVSNLKINDAELAVTARDGVLRVEPLGANLYDGSIKMQGQAAAGGKRQSYQIRGDLNDLKFGPLLKDLVGTGKVDGAANMKVNLTTAGNTVEDMKRALNGNVSFEFLNGSFNGFDLAQILETARANLRGKPAEISSNGTTPFSRFAAAFSVRDGLLSGDDLALNTGTLNAQGSGNFNIVTNALDYLVKVVVPQNSDKLENLRGVSVPIKLSGDLLSPSYSVDMAGALKGLADARLQEEKAEVQEKIQEKKQELNDEVQKKLQKGLGDFLGN